MNWVTNNRDWLAPYVRQVADAMGLRDWNLYLNDDKPDKDDCSGQCLPAYGRKHASLWFDIPESPAHLRHTVVHELLHCHGALVDWSINSIQPALSLQTFEVWRGSYGDAKELMIDGIADVLSPYLPLPMHEIRMPTEDADQGPDPEEAA